MSDPGGPEPRGAVPRRTWTPSAFLAALAVLVGAAVCVRLGFWQVGRFEEKRLANAALRARLQSPPLRWSPGGSWPEGVEGRRIEVRGRFDETRHVLLVHRLHAGTPGVEVVTPLLVSGDSSAVLANRGWLEAMDGTTAYPEAFPEPGERTVVGIIEPLRRGAAGPPIRSLPSRDPGAAKPPVASAVRYAARWLDLDSLAVRLPYALAPFVLQQLPGDGVPPRPLRRGPSFENESMHMGYAIQWFAFAAILVGGSVLFVLSRRREGGRPFSRRS